MSITENITKIEENQKKIKALLAELQQTVRPGRKGATS